MQVSSASLTPRGPVEADLLIRPCRRVETRLPATAGSALAGPFLRGPTTIGARLPATRPGRFLSRAGGSTICAPSEFHLPGVQIGMADYDLMTEQGARELARRIVAYWANRGCKVDVRVEKVEDVPHATAVWGVRSGLGLIVPPGASDGQD